MYAMFRDAYVFKKFLWEKFSSIGCMIYFYGREHIIQVVDDCFTITFAVDGVLLLVPI